MLSKSIGRRFGFTSCGGATNSFGSNRTSRLLSRSSRGGEDDTHDWRKFRAKLVLSEEEQSSNDMPGPHLSEPNLELFLDQDSEFAQSEPLWAHAVPGPEQGGLLIATSMVDAGTSHSLPEHLWQTVIFLLEHSPNGTVGLVLNRPTILSLQKTMLRDEMGESRLRTSFAENRLYCGGEHKQEIISILHRYDTCGGQLICPGVYLGGNAGAVSAVESLERDPFTFKFFSGCEMWMKGELEKEIEDGLWHCAAASSSLILKNCLNLPVPLYVETLKLMGGKYAVEAARVYEE